MNDINDVRVFFKYIITYYILWVINFVMFGISFFQYECFYIVGGLTIGLLICRHFLYKYAIIAGNILGEEIYYQERRDKWNKLINQENDDSI